MFLTQTSIFVLGGIILTDLGMQKETYTVKEIAGILEISTKSAYSLVNEHFFSFVKVGRVIRISKKSFDNWLNSDADE